MKHLKPLLALFISLTISSCLERKTNQSNHQQVSRELPSGIIEPKKIETKPIWIDVRTADEFQAGHLEAAINIPHDQISEKLPEIVPDKSATLNFYCRSGNRTKFAMEAAQELGYSNITDKGSYEELKQE